MGDRTFGKMLKTYRVDQALTLRDLANKLECSYPYLSQLEAGIAKPSEELVKKVAKVFHLTPKEEEEMLFLARGIREQLEEIISKYPNIAAKYFRKVFQQKK
jgi:transcriptional regulator with XRE-family HTH domain